MHACWALASQTKLIAAGVDEAMPNVTRAPSLAVGHWSQVWLRDISPKMLSAVSFSPRGVWTGDDVETLRLLPDGDAREP